MTDWRDYSPADFDASQAPRGTARKRAAELGAATLFDVRTPVTRPRPAAEPAGQLPGQTDIFAQLNDEDERNQP